MKKGLNKYKKISFIDRENEKIIEYIAEFKDNENSYNEFYDYISNQLENYASKDFRPGVSKKVVLASCKKLLNSNCEDFNLGIIISLFRSPVLPVVKDLVKHLLGLLDFKSKNELPISDFVVLKLFSKHPNFEGSKEAEIAKNKADIISANSKILNQNFINNIIYSNNKELSTNKK